MKVVLFYECERPAQRLHGTTAVLRDLVRIAGQARPSRRGRQRKSRKPRPLRDLLAGRAKAT